MRTTLAALVTLALAGCGADPTSSGGDAASATDAASDAPDARPAWQCDPALGIQDCDGNRANSCETSITTVANCGACGRACPATAMRCIGGMCI